MTSRKGYPLNRLFSDLTGSQIAKKLLSHKIVEQKMFCTFWANRHNEHFAKAFDSDEIQSLKHEIIANTVDAFYRGLIVSKTKKCKDPWKIIKRYFYFAFRNAIYTQFDECLAQKRSGNEVLVGSEFSDIEESTELRKYIPSKLSPDEDRDSLFKDLLNQLIKFDDANKTSTSVILRHYLDPSISCLTQEQLMKKFQLTHKMYYDNCNFLIQELKSRFPSELESLAQIISSKDSISLLKEENKTGRKYKFTKQVKIANVSHEDKTTTLHAVYERHGNEISLILSVDRLIKGKWVSLCKTKKTLIAANKKMDHSIKIKLEKLVESEMLHFKTLAENRKQLYLQHFSTLGEDKRDFNSL